MKFPWANILLLGLLLIQLVTGYFGFTNGRLSHRWITWLHGIGAYGLILLLYWKSAIVVDALRRKKRWTRRRIGFFAMVALLIATLGAGLAWTYYGPIYLAGFSLVSLHIYLAIPLMALMLWHSWHMRFIFRARGTVERREAVRALGAVAMTAVLWRAAALAKRVYTLPGAKRRFTGSYERGSFTGRFPSVSWIADRPKPIEAGEWRLRVDGSVTRPLTLTYGQVGPMAEVSLVATLDCTGGWFSTQEWQGVPVARLLEMAGVQQDGNSVTFESVTGYQRRFSLGEARGYLLATAVAGRLLEHGHGFPLRLVAPDQRGVTWVKWVTHIRVNSSGKQWQLPLPLQ